MPISTSILEKLDEMIVEHNNFNDTSLPILTNIQHGSIGRLIMVIGPTGVGKTTLTHYCVDKLNNYIDAHPQSGFGRPVILGAHAPETGSFNWKDFYINALFHLSEPGINHKTDIDKSVENLKKGILPSINKNLTTYNLRSLFIQSVNIHKPLAVFIDEVQHLAMCTTNGRKVDNMNVLKSLSDECHTKFICTGTYEARSMMYHGGQLSRRVNIIHFERYRGSNTPDVMLSILNSIIDELAIPVSSTIYTKGEYFCNHTLGCTGILVTWLRCAIEHAIQNNSNQLTYSNFQKTRLSNLQLKSILSEITAFENEHNDQTDFVPHDLFGEMPNKDTTNTTKPTTRQPGNRNPTRDPIASQG